MGVDLTEYTIKNGGTRQEQFCTHRYMFEECSLKSTILVFKRSEVNLLTNRETTKSFKTKERSNLYHFNPKGTCSTEILM